MAHEVVLPWGDAFAYQGELVGTSACLLIHLDTEVHHLACYVGKRLILSKFVWHTTDGDAKEGGTSCHGLRDDDGTPFVTYT